MYPNKITELLRDSMMAISTIKDAVEGHIYSQYIDQSSKFPCITHHIFGGSLNIVKGACSPVIQCRIWTDKNKDFTSFLYTTYGLIYASFFSSYKRSLICSYCNKIFYFAIDTDYTSTPCPKCKQTGFLSDYLNLKIEMNKNYIPVIMQENYESLIIYSLPFFLNCEATYKET